MTVSAILAGAEAAEAPPRPRTPADRRLLIVACSATKAEGQAPMAAVDRYRGAYWQMVRAVPEGRRPNIVVLSAKHGFIGGSTPIEDYDQRMTQQRARDLAADPATRAAFAELLAGLEISEVMVAAGAEYRQVIDAVIDELPEAAAIERTAGRLGDQRGQLGAWLAAGDVRAERVSHHRAQLDATSLGSLPYGADRLTEEERDEIATLWARAGSAPTRAEAISLCDLARAVFGRAGSRPAPARPPEPASPMSIDEFTAHLAELRARDWPACARLVVAGLDALPAGAEIRINRWIPVTHTKQAPGQARGGLDWLTVGRHSRMMQAGPRRGQTVTTESRSHGAAYGLALDVALARIPLADVMPIIEAAHRGLAEAGALPALPAAQDPAPPATPAASPDPSVSAAPKRRGRKPKERPEDPTREDRAARLGPTLPDEPAAQLAVGAEIAAAYDRAVTAGDRAAADAEGERYQALIFKMNGGTFFGCKGGPDKPGAILAAAIGADPGAVPAWGQNGDFVVEAHGVRARVEFRDEPGDKTTWYAFHAVDVDAPFISPTGYQSRFASDPPPAGQTVDQAAAAQLARCVAEGKLRAIEPGHRGSCVVPEWVEPPQAPADQAPAGACVVLVRGVPVRLEAGQVEPVRFGYFPPGATGPRSLATDGRRGRPLTAAALEEAAADADRDRARAVAQARRAARRAIPPEPSKRMALALALTDAADAVAQRAPLAPRHSLPELLALAAALDRRVAEMGPVDDPRHLAGDALGYAPHQIRAMQERHGARAAVLERLALRAAAGTDTRDDWRALCALAGRHRAFDSTVPAIVRAWVAGVAAREGEAGAAVPATWAPPPPKVAFEADANGQYRMPV